MSDKKTTPMVAPTDATGKELTDAQAQVARDASPLAVLEESGVAFDPATQHLDLTKDEKRRTTALMMAIQAYQGLIIKDADYLREAVNHERNGGPTIRPATMDAMVEAAIQFDWFIAGEFDGIQPTKGNSGRAEQIEIGDDQTSTE